MKQIFTLVLATALSFISAFGQINETFETVSGLPVLNNRCWQFSGVTFSEENIVTDSNSLAVLPTTTTGTAALIVTPYINLTTATSISFTYKLGNKLSNLATRSILIRLLNINGSYTELGSISLNKTSTTEPVTFNVTSPISSIQKLVIEITGSGDGNSYLYIDDIAISSTFNYNSPYGCNTSENSPLPIHLKSFQGLLSVDKVTLNWSVAENENGNFFELQKSSDGKTFKTIALIATTQISGDETYSYKDELGASSYYRIKLISKGGLATYSTVLFIKRTSAIANEFSLLQNPVQQSLKFTFTSESNAVTEVAVYNMLGVKVFQTTFAAAKGANTISKTLDGHIQRGSYVLEVKNATNRSIAKFLKD